MLCHSEEAGSVLANPEFTVWPVGTDSLYTVLSCADGGTCPENFASIHALFTTQHQNHSPGEKNQNTAGIGIEGEAIR